VPVENVNSDSAEKTYQIARQFAQRIKKGDVIALSGELGAGKTVFAKGLCRGLGCNQMVSSPSYTLVNIYQGDYPIYHVDCYRLDSSNEIIDLDPDQLFYPDGITIIEWAEKVRDYLPANTIQIEIEIIDESHRTIQINLPDTNI